MLVNPDHTQNPHRKEEVRSRQRASTSCTECRRRKQKCSQTRDRPCNNCVRRYPPVACVYEGLKKASNKEKASEFGRLDVQPKIEEFDVESSNILAPIRGSSRQSSLNSLKRKPVLQLITSGSKSAWAYVDPSGRSAGYIQHEDYEIETPSPAEWGDISTNIQVLEYPPCFERFGKSYVGISKMSVGSVALEPLYSLPIDSSIRNAQLLHFFLQRLAPYMSSLDGNDPSIEYNEQVIPFLIQSPIAAYIAILTSGYFQATSRRIEWHKSVDVMGARVKLITMINEHLTAHESSIKDEAIATVMSLAYNELVYADERSTLAHMRGLAEMVEMRGGLQNIEFVKLREMLAKTDYHVAFTFECDLFLSKTRSIHVPTFESYPLELNSPLLKSEIRFVELAEALGISIEAASILDDMRFLTTSIIHLTEYGDSEAEIAKLMTTVHWIHERLVSPRSAESELTNDFMYQTCRTAGIIYSKAILTRTALSRACTAELLQQLWMTMWRVPLARWKRTPALFLWVMLVVNSYARNLPESRFLKGLFPSAVVTMGSKNWNATIASLDGFLAVQKWLGGVNRVFIVPSRHSPKPVMPEGGIPEWAIGGEGEEVETIA